VITVGWNGVWPTWTAGCRSSKTGPQRTGPCGTSSTAFWLLSFCDLAGWSGLKYAVPGPVSYQVRTSCDGTPMKRLLPPGLFTVILGILLAGNAFAATAGTTYYIAASGSDTNNGTSKTTPWAHAPGMNGCTGACAAVTPSPGDQFIFRGGDTWGPTNWPWAPAGTGGTSGNTICIACVDQTWFSGASWTRPIFSGGGTYPGTQTGWPTGHFLAMDYLSYWTVDNIEFTGAFYNNSTWGSGAAISCNNGSDCTNFEVTNCYAHGWTHGSGSGVTDIGAFLTVNGQNNATSSAYDNVIDGSDTTGDSYSAFAGGPGIIYDNYVNQVVNVVNSNVTGTLYVHDNTFLNTSCSFDGVTHGNAVQNNAPSTGVFGYNKLVEQLSSCTFPLNMQAGSNSTNYFFNNVYVDVSNIAVSLSTYAGGGISNATFYAFSNTVEPGSDSGSGTSNNVFSIDGDSTNAVYNVCDNQGITSGGLTTVYGSGGSYTLRCTSSISNTSTDNLLQNKSSAASAGYTSVQAYPFSPIAATSPTVIGGTGLSSICNGISDPTSQAACLSDTSLGVAEVLGSGGYTVSAPNRTPTNRSPSGAWNIGAYQFAAGTPTAPTGLAAVVQ
jgi:hypothetical protein